MSRGLGIELGKVGGSWRGNSKLILASESRLMTIHRFAFSSVGLEHRRTRTLGKSASRETDDQVKP